MSESSMCKTNLLLASNVLQRLSYVEITDILVVVPGTNFTPGDLEPHITTLKKSPEDLRFPV